MAGLTLRTVSLTKTSQALSRNGVTNWEIDRSLIVPARLALNTTLEFVE
jgi:hypothetical protein